MPPLVTFTSQVNIVDAVTPYHDVLMCKKSLWSSFSVVYNGMRQDTIIPTVYAILPVPTEMHRIELNEFIVL
jgi:hypothetical protein